MYWQHHIDKVDENLERLIPVSKQKPLNRLSEACLYSLMAPSKRIRSVIAIITAEALGLDASKVLDAACALEMVHTYSLIHDDLPCMDDDNMRRGKPALHIAYDESTAILAGDYLLTRAFEVISQCNDLDSDIKIELIQSLSQKAGYNGMIGGQIIDIFYEDKNIELDMLKQLHSLKTGALLIQAVEIAIIISKAPDDIRKLLRSFAEKIGLAFQVIDDILDVTGSTEELGKPAQSDLNQNKSTYVSLLGIGNSKKYADSLINEAFQILKQLPYNTDELKEIAEYILKRKN